MRNLPQPTRETDRVDLRTAVREYRYRGQTRGHEITDEEVEQVVALYDRYEQNRGAPCVELRGADLPDSLRDTIHAAYAKTQEGRTLQPLRDRLFEGVDLCPVCGIDPATELDHHLPQSEFKPLAIHSRKRSSRQRGQHGTEKIRPQSLTAHWVSKDLAANETKARA